MLTSSFYVGVLSEEPNTKLQDEWPFEVNPTLNRKMMPTRKALRHLRTQKAKTNHTATALRIANHRPATPLIHRDSAARPRQAGKFVSKIAAFGGMNTGGYFDQ